ncbi:hypothetical protein D1007_02480 [Hordeum vulgare]|nr:hypothetical protein D1007_02480 [Hordeum vulgare]
MTPTSPIASCPSHSFAQRPYIHGHPLVASQSCHSPLLLRTISEQVCRRGDMADWAPVFIALVLFVLLSPGLLFQVPGKNRFLEFGSKQTSGVSVLFHAVIYFALIAIFTLAVRVHVILG